MITLVVTPRTQDLNENFNEEEPLAFASFP